MHTDELLTSSPDSSNTLLAAVRVNDVYSFRYNVEETKKRFEPYHCFDGTLVAKKDDEGKLYLVDTYWSTGDCRTFTIEKAIKEGELTFLCNLDDMEDISQQQTIYYDDTDIVYMRIHAGYRSRWLIKKGTQRSKSKMLQSIKKKIEEAEYKISSAEWDIKRHKETLEKIESGDITVYI